MRFHSTRDRDRFTFRHGVLRLLLATYLGCGPRQVNICISAHGKPFVVVKDDAGSLQFNLSHSGGYATFAFSRYNNLGVDIDKVREIPELDGIVENYFTAHEKQMISSSPNESKLKIFYRLLARKEAVLKADWKGLLIPLNDVN